MPKELKLQINENVTIILNEMLESVIIFKYSNTAQLLTQIQAELSREFPESKFKIENNSLRMQNLKYDKNYIKSSIEQLKYLLTELNKNKGTYFDDADNLCTQPVILKKDSEVIESFLASISEGKLKTRHFREIASGKPKGKGKNKYSPRGIEDISDLNFNKYSGKSLCEHINITINYNMAHADNNYLPTQSEGEEVENNILISWFGTLPNERLLANWDHWLRINGKKWQLHILYDPSLLTSSEVEKFEALATAHGFNLHKSTELFEPDIYSEIQSSGPYANHSRRADRDMPKFSVALGGLRIDAGDVNVIDDQPLPEKFYLPHGVLFNNNITFRNDNVLEPHFGLINNDIMIAKKGSPTLKKFIEAMAKNDKKSSYLPTNLLALRATKDETIEQTGPGFLRKFLESQFPEIESTGHEDNLKLELDWCLQNKFFKNDKQDLSWLNEQQLLPRKKYLSAQQNYDDIVRRSQLEETLFGKSLFIDYMFDYMLQDYPLSGRNETFEGEEKLNYYFKTWKELVSTKGSKATIEEIGNTFTEISSLQSKDKTAALIANRLIKLIQLNEVIRLSSTVSSQPTLFLKTASEETLLQENVYRHVIQNFEADLKLSIEGMLNPEHILQQLAERLTDIPCPPEIRNILDEYLAKEKVPTVSPQ